MMQNTLFSMGIEREISYTQVSTYERCKFEYKYRFIDKKAKGNEQFKNPNVVVGSSLHVALYKFYKVFHGNNRTLDNLLKLFIEDFSKKWGIFLSEYKYEREINIEIGKNLLNIYHDTNDHRIEPKELERKFLCFYLNNQITGIIDRIDMDDYGIEVIDYKYANYDECTINIKRLQASFYYLGCKSIFNIFPKHIIFYHLDKNVKERIELTENEINNSMERVIQMINELENRDTSFSTSKNQFCIYCPAYSSCPEYR